MYEPNSFSHATTLSLLAYHPLPFTPVLLGCTALILDGIQSLNLDLNDTPGVNNDHMRSCHMPEN